MGELLHPDAPDIKVHEDVNAMRLQALGVTKGGRGTEGPTLVQDVRRAVQISLAPCPRFEVEGVKAIPTPGREQGIARIYGEGARRGTVAAVRGRPPLVPRFAGHGTPGDTVAPHKPDPECLQGSCRGFRKRGPAVESGCGKARQEARSH